MYTVKIISVLIGISFISYQGSEFQASEVQERGGGGQERFSGLGESPGKSLPCG